MPPTSTLKTPLTNALTLTRSIDASGILTVEVHGPDAAPLYSETIVPPSAAARAPAEPLDPEQGL